MNKVWIYQADRILTKEEVSTISEEIDSFVASWTAHGSALAGSGKIENNLFLILEVNEEQAGVTGCSVDKSVHFIKSLGTKYAIDFFNRLKVSYKDENGNVALVDREAFQVLVHAGRVSEETIVYNNLVQNSVELKEKWQIPFRESWHQRVFK